MPAGTDDAEVLAAGEVVLLPMVGCVEVDDEEEEVCGWVFASVVVGRLLLLLRAGCSDGRLC